jgi:hypothetical protein
MCVYGIQRPKVAIQISRHEAAKKPFVTWEADLLGLDASARERADEEIELGSLSGAVDSFQNDELAASWHAWESV